MERTPRRNTLIGGIRRCVVLFYYNYRRCCRCHPHSLHSFFHYRHCHCHHPYHHRRRHHYRHHSRIILSISITLSARIQFFRSGSIASRSGSIWAEETSVKRRYSKYISCKYYNSPSKVLQKRQQSRKYLA